MSDLINGQKVIDTEGLDVQIRCEMCRNPMHTDRGCDGNCTYDEKLYERIIQILDERIKTLPSVEPERLTDDDFETIRIHLNACKEKLCNQRRWKEAEEYQRIIDRFMAFASAEPDVPDTNVGNMISRQAAIDAPVKMVSEGLDWIPVYHLKDLPSAEPEKAKRGFWYTIEKGDKGYSAGDFRCSVCNEPNHTWIPKPNFCPNCGADMRGEEE